MDLPSRAPLPRWVPFAVLALAGVYLTLRWDEIPPRWVIHWSAAGTPNGWAVRTPAGVLQPLLIGAATLGFVEFLLVVSRNRANVATAVAPLRAATEHFVRGMSLAIAMVFAFLAIDLPLGPRLPLAALVAIPLALVVAALASGGARVASALREIRQSGHGDKVEGHHALYYSNAKDPRLWVPKLSGTGLTLNFAHPWAWPVMLLLVGVPIGLAIVSTVAAHSP